MGSTGSKRPTHQPNLVPYALPGDIIVYSQGKGRPNHVVLVLGPEMSGLLSTSEMVGNKRVYKRRMIGFDVAHCVPSGCKSATNLDLPQTTPCHIIRWKGDPSMAVSTALFARMILRNKKPFATCRHVIRSALRKCYQNVAMDNPRQFLRALQLPEWLAEAAETKTTQEVVNAHNEQIQSLFCSEFALTVWQLNLAFHAVKNVHQCMNLIPGFCYPSNVLELPKKYPSCWTQFRVENMHELIDPRPETVSQ
jgi:hypothetical protein